MDPMSLAIQAVGLLAPFLGTAGNRLAERVGDAAATRLERLYDKVRTGMARDHLSRTTLEQLRKTPDNEQAQGAAQYALAQAIEKDQEFAAVLAQLVEEARSAGGVDIAQIRDAGAVAIRGDVRMQGEHVAGRDMIIGDRTRSHDRR
jgi:hypothetical protein